MRLGLPPLTRRARVVLGICCMAVVVAALGWGWRYADRLFSAARTDQGVPVESDICIVAPPTPFDPASGLPMLAPRAVPPQARCPVCGMFPARSPEWAAQVIFQNGDAQFFDSPLSLFMYLQNPERYSPGRSQQTIVARYVNNATHHQWIDATTAWYVHGSNALGPMRSGNLPAFQSRDDAAQFARKRGGRVVAFGDIDAKLLATIPGASHHQGHASHPQSKP